jgi:hypothetical protein
MLVLRVLTALPDDGALLLDPACGVVEGPVVLDAPGDELPQAAMVAAAAPASNGAAQYRLRMVKSPFLGLTPFLPPTTDPRSGSFTRA